jgi:hypothetical protein
VSLSRKSVILCVCASAAIAAYSGESHAFALQRLVAAVDVSHTASGTVTISSTALAANVPARLTLPASIDLMGPSTELRVGVPSACSVTIEVADDAGAPLFLAEVHMPAGWQKLGFSGRDAAGNLLPNGTYYYTVTADGTSRTVRVTVNR